MSSTRVEIDEIIDDKIDQKKTLFQVRLKKPSVEFWLSSDKIPSADLIIKYVVRLIPRLPSKQSEIDRSSERIYGLLKEPVKNELDNLSKTFRTFRGLELPCSKYYQVVERLRNMIRECDTDYDAISTIRRDILVEEMIEKRKQQLESLKRTEMYINVISDHRKPIKVVNDYDLEEFPSSLKYINKQIAISSETKLETATIGCECQSSEDCRSSSCLHYDYEMTLYLSLTAKKVGGGKKSDCAVVPYDEKGRSLKHYPKYECNELCKCDASCPRKVVSKGSNVELEIFRTFSGYGWGVRTLEAIEKGTFVSRYAGEIILWEEANKRSCHEYLFDIEFAVDPDIGHPKYTIDGYRYGNISRFVNHNCKPNLNVQVVYIENISLGLGEICFFAEKDIAANEELSINYKDLVVRHNGICKCSTCVSHRPF